MIDNRQHIIAHCNWNTSFDSKEHGVQLQDMISHWSRYHLSRELNPIFNTICPEGQTLKINALEVDLGIIEYANFQEELTLKLKEQLFKKLQDIIMYPYAHGQGLEIIQEDISYIESLKCFLLQGIMPWNYSKTDGNIHAIFDNQILHNSAVLMKMILSVGVHQYVRRRIAWQLKDAVIKKIIKNLEPSNHHQIFLFSEEIVNIQKKESIVKTSLHDFKKNLWFWILNYLFVERGTIFNKMTFVKSNIRQMANHFNIAYYTLFELIEEAVYRIHKNTSIKNDFILILIALSKEQNEDVTAPVTLKQKEQHWELLENMFLNPLSRKVTTAKNKLNDLILYFVKTDPSRLKKFLFSSAIKSNAWIQIFSDLRPSVVEKVFYIIAPEKGTRLVSQIRFFKTLEVQQAFALPATRLWDIGIKFLLKNHAKTYDDHRFMTHVVTTLSRTHHFSKTEVLEKLIHTEIKHTHKTIDAVSMYKVLKEIHMDTVLRKDVVFTKERFSIILHRLQEVLQNNSLDQIVIHELHTMLLDWIEKDAIKVWDMLLEYPNKEQIIPYISALIGEQKAQVFIERKHQKEASFLKDFQDSIALAISQKTSNQKLLITIQSCIVTLGLEIMLRHKNGTFIQFVTRIIAQLRVQEGIGNSLNFAKAISEILSIFYQRIGDASLQKLLKKEQDALLKDEDTLTLLDSVIKEPSRQSYVAKLLKELLINNRLETQVFQSLSVEVQAYLLPNTASLLQDLIKEYILEYKTYSNKQDEGAVKEILRYIYWNCLIDYQSYRGDKALFKTLFKKAVYYRFEALKSAKVNIGITTKKYPIAHHDKLLRISEEGVYTYIERCIITSELSIQIDKKNVAFKTILVVGLEQSPERIRQLIYKSSITKQQLDVFVKAIDFEQFVSLIATDIKEPALSQFYVAVCSLYRLLHEIKISRSITGSIHHFWQQIFKLLKGKKQHTTILKELTVYTLDLLSKENGMNTEHLMRYSIEKHIKIPEVLKKRLVIENAAFKTLPVSVQENKKSKDITYGVTIDKIEEVLLYVLHYNKIPSWFYTTEYHNPKIFLKDIAIQYPLQLLSVLRRHSITEMQFMRLYEAISYTEFLGVLKQLYPRQQKHFEAFKNFYAVLGTIEIIGMSSKMVRNILFQKLLTAWKTSNWELISDSVIWTELLWEICAKRSISKTSFFNAFDDLKIRLPVALQITYDQIQKSKKIQVQPKESTHLIPPKIMSEPQKPSITLSAGITVHNAGMVIMNTYIAMLFDRLGLVENNSFTSDENQLDAVHYLQYLITGLAQTEESLLVLNKVLCGIPITTPIKEGIEISEDHKNLIHGLIEAAIGYWPAIGQCSVDGFRGNWLVRDGILREEEDRWELQVEKRSYDILMLKSPFSFSIIKLPWMTKPLHVIWSF
ncbi:contractile injection system tape measure protein [Dokdonia sp.]|uniref:contractile injection system tape measure protein n=1 Tax=Dokdonia sp. TaxID=2024995 RepID=UPI0032630EF5